jgi:hypothetical protein
LLFSRTANDRNGLVFTMEHYFLLPEYYTALKPDSQAEAVMGLQTVGCVKRTIYDGLWCVSRTLHSTIAHIQKLIGPVMGLCKLVPRY